MLRPVAAPPPPQLDPFRHARLGPYLLLSEAILVDVFLVRDAYLRSLAAGRKPRPSLHRQYHWDLSWISSKDVTYVFSFVPVCEYLGLDPSLVRIAYLSQRRFFFPIQRGSRRSGVAVGKKKRKGV